MDADSTHYKGKKRKYSGAAKIAKNNISVEPSSIQIPLLRRSLPLSCYITQKVAYVQKILLNISMIQIHIGEMVLIIIENQYLISKLLLMHRAKFPQIKVNRSPLKALQISLLYLKKNQIRKMNLYRR